MGIDKYRFSGHETFPCRYGWLPKAARALDVNPEIFLSESDAMISLGIGKNMVRALRFWAEATGVAKPAMGKGLAISDFGRALLLGEDAFDPYLEDLQTLWLLHWKLLSHPTPPLFAWDFLFNRWQNTQLVRSDLLSEFQQESLLQGKELSPVTLKQHLDVFLRTYIPPANPKGPVVEDSLDCPLTELRLIQEDGPARSQSQERGTESAYSFRRDRKSEIRSGLFLYCVVEFWQQHHADEDTLSYDSLAYGRGSPGLVFKMPDSEIRDRMIEIAEDNANSLAYQESLHTQQLVRSADLSDLANLAAIYRGRSDPK